MFNHAPGKYICPLCNAVGGIETPGRSVKKQDIVYQDKLVTAFIAGKWWVNSPGHVIVIPNKHIENIYDITAEYSHRIADIAREVAIALKKTYKCDGVSLRQHNEPAGNQDVWHYHLHVFPRKKGDELYVNHLKTNWVTPAERLPYAKKLKKYFDKLNK